MAGTSPEIGLRLTLAPKSGRAEALSAHPRLLSAVLASIDIDLLGSTMPCEIFKAVAIRAC